MCRVDGVMVALALALASGLAWTSDGEAQTTIRGRVADALDGRGVAATIAVAGPRGAVATAAADARGEFTIENVPEGLWSVSVTAPGYPRAEIPGVRTVLNRVTPVRLELVRLATGAALGEVVVSARAVKPDPFAAANAVDLDRETLRRNPGSGGDVFRALDVLPGVVATGEFSNFTVRGNGPRDNLILVDGIPFGKVVHFDQSLGEQEDIGGGGRFSIFAPNLIGRARFSPGGWRAAEGGKNGSLLELQVAEGNPDSSTVGTRLELAGAELDYDGPLPLTDDTSVLASVRSYDFSRLFELIGEDDVGEPKLTDVIFKSVTEFGDRDQVEILAIHAPERYRRTVENARASENLEDLSLIRADQHNDLLGVTWRRSFAGGAQLRNALYFRRSEKRSSQGEARLELGQPLPPVELIPVRDPILQIDERERELGWRSDLTVPGARGVLTAGLHVRSVDLDFDRRLSGDWARFVYDSGDFRPDPRQRFIVLTPAGTNFAFADDALRAAGYVDYAIDLRGVTLTPGLRYEYDGFSGSGRVAPRLLATWQRSAVERLWASAGVFHQPLDFLELASDPANVRLAPERSTQLGLGYSRLLGERWQFTAEAYAHRLDDRAVLADRTTEVFVARGTGTARGIDLSLTRPLAGGLSLSSTYSYARARRDDRDGSGTRPADWDRPHAFGINAIWEPSDRWAFSARWRYASGRPTDSSIRHENVLGPGQPLRFSKQVLEPNALRLPAFHALSLRVDYRRRFGPVSVVAFADVLNAYGRSNGNALEWDERRGIDIVEGLDEPLPTFGLRFEYSWTAGSR